MPLTTYTEAMDYWFGRVNYEQRVPLPGDLKLDRMRALLARLNNPHNRLRIVHVAGSKGKGSTSAMIASVLRAAGYRTGLFTSPHLSEVEERCQVNGSPIARAELIQLLDEIREAEAGLARESDAPLPCTFFEVITALGFLYFLRRRVEVAVVEVGLGGRFDSTNVCRPLVAVITSISFDHTRLLGNTLGSIATEKAGILKPGRPALSGVCEEEPRKVIERLAAERRVPLRQLGIDFGFHYEPARVAGTNFQPPRVQITTRARTWPLFELGLWGSHQASNAALAVACVELLQHQGLHIPDAAVQAGMAGVKWPARLEIVATAPLTILDCAHNVASAEALVETLTTSFPPSRRILVFATSGDKDVAGMFRVLAPHFSLVVLTRYTTNQRGVSPETLREILEQQAQVPHLLAEVPQEALRIARAAAGPNDILCITGSVFLAGELRPHLVP